MCVFYILLCYVFPLLFYVLGGVEHFSRFFPLGVKLFLLPPS